MNDGVALGTNMSTQASSKRWFLLQLVDAIDSVLEFGRQIVQGLIFAHFDALILLRCFQFQYISQVAHV